jgi:hypothetical protein
MQGDVVKAVVVLMKSGHKLTLQVEDFTLTIANGKVTALNWVHLDDAETRLAFLDLEEIAAVWQVM